MPEQTPLIITTNGIKGIHMYLTVKHAGVVELVEFAGQLLFVLFEVAAVQRSRYRQRLQKAARSFTNYHSEKQEQQDMNVMNDTADGMYTILREADLGRFRGSAVPAAGRSSGFSMAHWSAAGRPMHWGLDYGRSFNR